MPHGFALLIGYSMKFSLLFASRWFLPLLLILLTILIYIPGLSGDFEFDDSINILDNAAIKVTELSRSSVLAAATSGKSGVLGRSVSMLSFAANYYFTQFDPFFFKLTNVLIHIFSGLSVYVFVYQLTLSLNKNEDLHQRILHAKVVALTTAGIWLVHPLNLTSVLYIVQRMTSLAALFTFWALALYVMGRRKTLDGRNTQGLLLMLIALGPVTGLAILSKENGALAPYLMLCVEIIVFRFASRDKGIRFFLYLLFSSMVLIPIGIAALNFDRVASFIASGYLGRDFSLNDRLLTQPQVLLFYLRLLILPDAGKMGIFHDDFPISSSLTHSLAAPIVTGSIFAFVVVGIFAIRKAPALAVGILWFLVGHSVESTFLALEMVHEHRNYLPIVGPIFTAAYYFWHTDFKVLAEHKKCGIVLAVVVVFSSVTYVRSVEWSNLVDHTAIEVHNHPNSVRANYQMGRVYFMLYNNERNMELAKIADQYFSRSATLAGSSIFPIIAMIQMAYKARVEPSPELVEMAAKRLQYGRPWEPNMLALNNLVNCQINQYCKLEDKDVVVLLLAALANPDASIKSKGTAHSLLGGYYAVKLENLELGIPHIKAAVEAEPDRIEYRLDLIRLYEVVNDLVSARAELKTARKFDTWGLQKERLDAEDALLDSALNARAK